MYEKQPAGHTRLIPLTAALVLLAVLLVLLPGRVFAADPVFNPGLSATISVPENTVSGTEIDNPYTATDGDSDTLTYTLSSTDATSFSIDSDGQLSTNTTLDYETKTSYSVTVGVHDGKDVMGDPDTSDDATMDVTINVTNVDEAGTVTIMGTLDGGEELTASVSDLDGTVSSATWQWSRGDMSDGTDFDDIDSATSTTYQSVAEDVGKYLMATVDYTDPQGSGKSAFWVTSSTIAASNAEPSFSSMTTTRNVDENTAANMNLGSAVSATDSDSSPTLTYALTGTDAGSFDIVTTTGRIRTKSALDYETKDSYSVMVTVHDGLDAAGDADTTVDDTITVTITVNDVNDAPTITSTGISFTALDFDENTSTSTPLATYTATDEDRPMQSLSWSLEDTDSGDFDISSAGVLTFAAVPNFESPADNGGNNVYNVTVKVADNVIPAKSDRLAVVVTVLDVNEPPDITSTTATHTAISFAEIQFDIADADLAATAKELETYAADDPESDTLAWSVSGTDAGSFTIDSSGKLSFGIRPDYERPVDVADSMMMGAGDNVYKIVVEVKDNKKADGTSDSTIDDTIDVTVTVTNVDETPEITTTETTHTEPSNEEIEYDILDEDLGATAKDVATYMARDEENETITWSLGGTDADDFSIGSSTGALSFINRPNYELPTDRVNTVENYLASDNKYQITVKATDGTTVPNTAENTRELEVTVTVTNVDETPEFTNPPPDRDFPEIEYDFDGTPDLVVARFTARDEEMEDIAWALAPGGDSDDLSITENPSGEGVVSFNSAPNFEMPTDSGTPNNVYEFTVVITDATAAPNTDANERTLDYVVTVTDVNERPDIREDTVADYSEVDFYFTGTPTMVHTFTAVDYDAGDTFTWSLEGVDAGDLSIDPSTDTPPNGILTFNQDDRLNLGPLPSYEDPQDANTDNTYEITVIATDDGSYPGEYPVTITVLDAEEEGRVAAVLPNDPPLVGDDLTFTLSDPDGGIVLTAGDIDWTIEARNPEGTEQDWESIDDDDPLSLVKTYTVDEDYTGKEIRATVAYEDRRSSGKEAASDDTNSVMDERAVAPPRFREGASQTIPEGEAGRDTDVESMATDRDGEVLIFGIQDGQDSDLFEIIPSDSTVTRTIQNVDYTGYTAQLRAIEALDYETVTSRSPTCPSKSLCLTLTLSDGKAFSNGRVIYDDEIDVTYDVTIEVTDVEEPGEITFSPDEVPEPGVEIAATLTDPDGGITGAMWQWQRSEDPEDEQPVWTPISGATSNTYTPDATNDVIASGDNEGDGFYLRATVSYTDGEGSGKQAMAIAGQVGTANTRPQFPAGESGQRSVPENSRAGTNIGEPVAAEDPGNNSLTYSLSELSEGLDDSEAFTIVSSTGQLRVKEPLDFENGQTQYIFNVDVHDRRDAAGRSSSYIDDTHIVIITVDNVDEEGTVALTTATNRIQATVPVTAELSDPDNASGISWQWARSSNRSDWEYIATGATYTPTADNDQGKYLRATASYTDEQDSNETRTAEIVSSRVAGSPPTNAVPVFPDSEDGQREVPENSLTDTPVGDPVAATDFNNDTLTYSLSGSDSAYFTIGANGQLRLQLEQDEALDYERKRTYRFTVRVSDGKNDDGVDDDPDNQRTDDSITVTVSLMDVNEAPVITGEAEREFRENGTSSVSTYSARDPEGDTITWSVNNSAFVITDRGQLYFDEPPSFEEGETYRVTVTATDDDDTRPLRALMEVTVTVTDVEERGEVILQPTKGWFADAVPDDLETVDTDETLPALQTRFTATLEDGDDIDGNVSWQWARSSSEDITDATSDSYKATIEDVNRSLRVTATYDDFYDDSDSQGDPVPETATAVLRSPIRDTSPGVNTQPQFTVPTAEELPEAHFDTRTITAGAVSGRSIGSRVSARDSEGDVLTYKLRGRDADKFELDPANGQIRTKAALDYLEQDTYTLSVSVHDGFDATYRPSASIDDTISIIITVLPPPPPRRTVRRSTTDDTPPNRPAEFSDGETTNRSVAQDAEAGTNVGRPVAASDPDGDTLTYALGGADAESFDIDAITGQLQTKAALDAETKSSYSVTVSVTDNKNAGGGRLAEIDDTINVTITVTTMALSDIAAMYDADEDGLISRDEAIAAVNDFFSGDITRDQVLEIIALYFESPATITELLEDNGEENE